MIRDFGSDLHQKDVSGLQRSIFYPYKAGRLEIVNIQVISFLLPPFVMSLKIWERYTPIDLIPVSNDRVTIKDAVRPYPTDQWGLIPAWLKIYPFWIRIVDDMPRQP